MVATGQERSIARGVQRRFPASRSGLAKRASLGAVVLALACTGGDGPAGEIDESPGTAAVPVGGVDGDGSAAIPATAVGAQLRWLLELIGERAGVANAGELEEHFTELFLAEVPPSDVDALFRDLAAAWPPITVRSIDPGATDVALVARLDTASGPFRVDIVVDAGSGQIDGLLLTLDDSSPLASWEDIEQRVAGLAPSAQLMVARVEADGCVPVRALAPERALAIGSAFKLYVLAAITERIRAGELGWTTAVTVLDELDSLPSGEVQSLPAGTELSVLELATRMISRSDNTATDHLLELAGRERVEAAMAASGHAAPELNIPLLSTRELFLFKLDLSPTEVDAYLGSGVPERRAFLEGLRGRLPSIDAPWTGPKLIEEIEWFASAQDLCGVMSALLEATRVEPLAPVASVLSQNPGLPIDTLSFPFVGFKGGSEPGVLNLTWVVRRVDGASYFVSLTWNDPENVIPEPAALTAALDVFRRLALE